MTNTLKKEALITAPPKGVQGDYAFMNHLPELAASSNMNSGISPVAAT